MCCLSYCSETEMRALFSCLDSYLVTKNLKTSLERKISSLKLQTMSLNIYYCLYTMKELQRLKTTPRAIYFLMLEYQLGDSKNGAID